MDPAPPHSAPLTPVNTSHSQGRVKCPRCSYGEEADEIWALGTPGLAGFPVYTSLYFLPPGGLRETKQKTKQKTKPKNNQTKPNKIKLSIEWWSSWPQREKVQSYPLAAGFLRPAPGEGSGGMGIRALAGLHLRRLGLGLSQKGESDREGEKGAALPQIVLGKTGEEDAGLGQRGFLCTRNHLETLIPSPIASWLQFRGDIAQRTRSGEQESPARAASSPGRIAQSRRRPFQELWLLQRKPGAALCHSGKSV